MVYRLTSCSTAAGVFYLYSLMQRETVVVVCGSREAIQPQLGATEREAVFVFVYPLLARLFNAYDEMFWRV
jgi:hypothetical protein